MLWRTASSFFRTQALTPSCLEYWLLKAHHTVPPKVLPWQKGACLNQGHGLGKGKPQATQPMMVTFSSTHNTAINIIIHVHLCTFSRNVLGCVYLEYLISVSFTQSLSRKSHLISSSQAPTSTQHLSSSTFLHIRLERKGLKEKSDSWSTSNLSKYCQSLCFAVFVKEKKKITETENCQYRSYYKEFR